MKTAVLAHNGDYVWADGAFNEHIVILRVQRSAALCEKKKWYSEASGDGGEHV